MKKLVLCLLVAIPSTVRAETYVCVTDAAAAVGDSQESGISASIVGDHQTFIYTEKDSKWIVKGAGGDYVLFDKCDNLLCERSNGYAGMFLFNKDRGVFSATWLGKDRDIEFLAVGKGRCTKL